MQTHEIRIRAAAPADADTLADFNLAMALETEDRRLDESKVRRGVAALLADARHGVYYVAEAGARIVGQMLITYEWSDWRNGRFWWIQSVYVLPDARRLGVYRALHRAVEETARATPGVCGLRLYVDRENTRAQQVYREMGMVQTDYLLFETDWA